jgi:hypothetical protein
MGVKLGLSPFHITEDTLIPQVYTHSPQEEGQHIVPHYKCNKPTKTGDKSYIIPSSTRYVLTIGASARNSASDHNATYSFSIRYVYTIGPVQVNRASKRSRKPTHPHTQENKTTRT